MIRVHIISVILMHMNYNSISSSLMQRNVRNIILGEFDMAIITTSIIVVKEIIVKIKRMETRTFAVVYIRMKMHFLNIK
jgi:hypothetical protein